MKRKFYFNLFANLFFFYCNDLDFIWLPSNFCTLLEFLFYDNYEKVYFKARYNNFFIIPILQLNFSKEHIEILSVKSELVFFRQRDGPWIPTLRLLHKCKTLKFFKKTFKSMDLCL